MKFDDGKHPSRLSGRANLSKLWPADCVCPLAKQKFLKIIASTSTLNNPLICKSPGTVMREKAMTEINLTRNADEVRVQFETAETLPSVRHSWNSNSVSSSGDDQQALLWQDRDSNKSKVNNVSPAEPSTSPETPRVIFCGSWPSIWDHAMHYLRPSMDLYVISAIFIYLFSPEAKEGSSVSWSVYRSNSFFFLVIPFMIRFCHGFVHFVLSIPILPGQIIFHEGPLLRILPNSILEANKESNALRELHRPRWQLYGAIMIQLISPDGMRIDAIYFRGDGASLNGPTVIRYNGNAEAFELQEETLPRMYTGKGINFLMFNYRGIGRSRSPKIWNSDAAGYFVNLWTTPCLCGIMLDAWTVLEYVVRELKVPPNQVVLAGHSIGAAIATQIAAAHPELPVNVCNSRSFATLSGVAVELTPALLGLPAGSNKAKWFRRLARGLLWSAGWELDSLRNWDKLKGFKWIEYSTADHIIPHPYSLHAALASRPGGLGMENASDGAQVSAAAISAAVAASARPLQTLVRYVQLVSLEGADNHNRSLLESEAAQHMLNVLEAVRRRTDTADIPSPKKKSFSSPNDSESGGGQSKISSPSASAGGRAAEMRQISSPIEGSRAE